MTFKIVREPIDLAGLSAEVLTDYDGALCVFQGVARRFSREREVVHLEYEAYPEMAERKMAEIAQEIREKFGVERVAIHHRVGELKIGEASVAIAVASPHRKEAFAACQHAIDRLKRTVPIWKKEVWSDGEEWIGWEHEVPSSEF
jgi:molybdopterin synthase catalytic subunit